MFLHQLANIAVDLLQTYRNRNLCRRGDHTIGDNFDLAVFWPTFRPTGASTYRFWPS